VYVDSELNEEKMDLLTSLVKAGGVSALAIGVVYLIYKEIIKLGIVPKLKQWQGFALLCLLATMVFVVAILSLYKNDDAKTTDFVAADAVQPTPATLSKTFSSTDSTEQTIEQNRQAPVLISSDELPPTSHFQLDTIEGVFCEEKNVHDPVMPYFDSIDISLQKCNGTNTSASRSYRIDWAPSGPKSVNPTKRRNYHQCFISDLSEHAPRLIDNLRRSFLKLHDAIPCDVSITISRIITASYTDLRNRPQKVAFMQTFNRGESKKFELEQVGIANLVRSDQLDPLSVDESHSVADQDLINISKAFRFPGVPAQ
jgi:hypothetical protein